MKKTLILLATVLLSGMAMAQQQYDTLSGPDGRIPRWHYTRWYDTVDTYYRDTVFAGISSGDVPLRLYEYSGDMVMYVKDEYVEHESLLQGVAVWQGDPKYYHFGSPVIGTTRVPEYVYLFKWNRTNDSLVVVDSLRWDTVQPKVLKLPFHSDSARFGFVYCYVYEAYFDKPVYVDSTFLLGGTTNNMERVNGCYIHRPVVYTALSPHWQTPVDLSVRWQWWTYNPADSSTRPLGPEVSYGFYMPIIEYANLDVRTADSTMGAAWPSIRRSKGTYQTIHATPYTGYGFSHWQDSVTDNPRTVFLTGDTVFTAYFRELSLHTVEAFCGDGHGYVSGDGTYCEGDVATLEARPYSRDYRFSHWQDSVADNPRSFVVTQDTVFTAYFAEHDPVGVSEADGPCGFTLSPNPAGKHVRVEMHGVGGEGWLTLVNATGQELVRQKVAPGEETAVLDTSTLPAGAYFVTLVTPQGSHTEKLLVK